MINVSESNSSGNATSDPKAMQVLHCNIKSVQAWQLVIILSMSEVIYETGTSVVIIKFNKKSTLYFITEIWLRTYLNGILGRAQDRRERERERERERKAKEREKVICHSLDLSLTM